MKKENFWKMKTRNRNARGSTRRNVKIEQSGESEISTGVPVSFSVRKRVRERSFMCELCGKKFLHPGHYKRHCKMHKASTRTRKKLKRKRDFSLTKYKQTINRSFVCVICDKGFGRNSHLKRHLKLHKDSDSLFVQKKQPKPQTTQVKSSILQATQSDSDNSGTSVEHNDSNSSDNLIEQIGSPIFFDPSEVTKVKSESSCPADVLNEVFVSDESSDGVGSPPTEDIETKLLISNSCNVWESPSKFPNICEAVLSTSLEDSEDLADDEAYVKIEQSDHSFASNESVKMEQSDDSFISKVIVEMINEVEAHSRDSLSIGMINHEMVEEVFCNICGKEFGRKSHLKRHVKIHEIKEIHECKICGKKFLQIAYLKAHVSTVHAEVKKKLEKIYECPVCDKKFGRMSHLKRHMKLHFGGETYDCKECGKKFLQNSHLKSHEKTHAKRLRLIDKGLVKRHVDKRTHTKNFDCKQCGKCFQLSSSLKNHINTVHVSNRIFDKCYECSFCGKVFGHNCQLKRHLKLHTGRQIYTGEVCGKGFKQNSNLEAHIRVLHLKERPHQSTQNHNSQFLSISREYDSRVDNDSEGGEFNSVDENTSDTLTYIKEESDVVVKEEFEDYEYECDYGSTNESEPLTSVIVNDVGQETSNVGAEAIDFQDVVKSVNESIKAMTRNRTLVLEQTDEDP